jgi:hypothetical protein
VSAEADRWREVDVKRALAAEVQEAGDALLAALEAAAADRDHWVKVATGTAAMLEARDRRIAELEAGLRRIVHSVPLEPHPSAEPKFRTIQRIARDLLNRERS